VCVGGGGVCKCAWVGVWVGVIMGARLGGWVS